MNYLLALATILAACPAQSGSLNSIKGHFTSFDCSYQQRYCVGEPCLAPHICSVQVYIPSIDQDIERVFSSWNEKQHQEMSIFLESLSQNELILLLTNIDLRPGASVSQEFVRGIFSLRSDAFNNGYILNDNLIDLSSSLEIRTMAGEKSVTQSLL